jgi:high-affinity K+ transport system ATPase subunit B
MIALVEGAKRQKTPNEIALTILLSALTIIFLLAVSSSLRRSPPRRSLLGRPDFPCRC